MASRLVGVKSDIPNKVLEQFRSQPQLARHIAKESNIRFPVLRVEIPQVEMNTGLHDNCLKSTPRSQPL